jgi:hypothetical protein
MILLSMCNVKIRLPIPHKENIFLSDILSPIKQDTNLRRYAQIINIQFLRLAIESMVIMI